MKTKLRELKENIARYIYNRLIPYAYDLEIIYNFDSRRWKLLSNKQRDVYAFVNEKHLIEKYLGIDLYNTFSRQGTLLWNKEKESKALGKELLRSADECARAFDDLIGQWIKEGKIKE